MKKLISMLLLVSMLLSMAVMPVSANDAERDLTSREYTYINLEQWATSDPFASWKDVWNYSRFNTAVDKSVTGIFSKVDYTYTDETEGEKTVNIWNFLPMTTYEGTAITGEEPYYKKGFARPGTTAYSTYIYVAEDLLYEDGAEIKGHRYNASLTNTAADAYTGKIEREEITKNVSAAHVKERLTESGKNYAIIENKGIPHKIGPLSETQLSPNSLYLSNAAPVTLPIADEGANLSMLFTTTTINTKGLTSNQTNVNVIPETGLQQVTIKYADESEETKYVVVTNTGKNYNKKDIERIVVYAPKKADGSAWTSADFMGDERKEFKFLTADNQAEHGVDVAAVTSEDVKFENENILMTDTAAVARVINNRMDASTSVYANRANLVTIKLQPKEVASVVFKKRLDFIGEPVETAIPIGTAATDLRQALVPVEVEGASENYDYFAYIGALSDYTVLLGATLGEYSLQDKIDILENKMKTAKLQSDVDAIDAEKAELIATTIVEESDFDAEIVAAYEIRKQEIAQESVELDRLESLKERKYTYLDLPKDRDVFVTFADLIDYGRFNIPPQNIGIAATTVRVNQKYTYAEGIELFAYLPHITSTGTAVTGQEDYYFRGFYNSANDNIPAVGERGYAISSTYAYLADSFFVEDGTKLTGLKVNATPQNNSKEYYEGTLERKEATKTIKAPTIVQPIDENGYAVIKNGDVLSKIGPIIKTEIKPNAVRLGNIAGSVITDVNVKGSSLDVLITSTGINYVSSGYTASKLGTKASPTAALQEIVINYKDGSFEKKKVLVINNAKTGPVSSDTAYSSILFAPKYKDGQEIIYTGESFHNESENNSFTMVKKDNLSTIGLTSVEQINKDTVKFENDDIIYSTVGTLASLVNNRMDVATSDYGAATSYASIPLQNKEIEKIAFNYNISAALEEVSAITVNNDPSNANAPSLALIPVEIEGASDDYVYFVYCGRVAQDSYLMAATVMDASAREKIDNAKAAMSAITENSTLEEAKKAKELFELACQEENVVVAKDFGDLATEFLETYEKIREKTPLKSKAKITFYEGDAPKVDVTIINEAELAGKSYKVLMAYYDEKGVMLDKVFAEGVSTEEKEIKLNLTKEGYNTKTKTVKVFVWKDLSTILPLADVTVAEAIEKKIYMFVGDSITHADQYPTYTESFFMTRFPNQVAEFANAGRSGGTAQDAVRRYDWDIQPNDATHAVIMFGMNDVGRTNYGEGNEEITAEKQTVINNCVDTISKLAQMIEGDGANVTIMTPSIYDERDYSTTTNLVGVNAALGKVAEGARALATAKNYAVIDNYALMNTINANYETSGVVEMIGTDRVHPNTQGAYVIAYNVIKTLFPGSGLVASVTIDADANTAQQENANVENLVATTSSVTYKYTPKALPWAVTDAYTKADGKYVNLTDELNREIIKVTGLEDGTYTLKIDGEILGQYTRENLEEGVNIAINAKNPGQIQACEVYALNELKHKNISELRDMALVENSLRIKGVYDDEEAAKAYIASLPSTTYKYSYYVNYYTYLNSVPTWEENVKTYTEQARDKAVPTAHIVEITK